MADNAEISTQQFQIAKLEIEQDLEVGQVGEINIPVEVIGITQNVIVFRKRDVVRSNNRFSQASLKDMEDALPKAERR